MIEENFRVLALQIAQKYFSDNSLTYTIADLKDKADEIYTYITTAQ